MTEREATVNQTPSYLDTPEDEWSEAQLDEFMENFEKLEPSLTDELIGVIEKDIGSNQPWGPWRRAGLCVLTRSGKQLAEAIESDRTGALAMAAVMHSAKSYAEQLRRVADLMDTASTRLMVALCWRDDMEDVIREAKKEAA